MRDGHDEGIFSLQKDLSFHIVTSCRTEPLVVRLPEVAEGMDV